MQTSAAESLTHRDRARRMKFAPFIASRLLLLAVLCLVGCATNPQCASSPLAVVKTDFSAQNADGRTVQHTLWQPERAGSYPLMVFSHGAFSAPQRYDARHANFTMPIAMRSRRPPRKKCRRSSKGPAGVSWISASSATRRRRRCRYP